MGVTRDALLSRNEMYFFKLGPLEVSLELPITHDDAHRIVGTAWAAALAKFNEVYEREMKAVDPRSKYKPVSTKCPKGMN